MTATKFAEAIGARLTLPSRSLLDGAKYVTADKSAIEKRFERVSEGNTTGAYLAPQEQTK